MPCTRSHPSVGIVCTNLFCSGMWRPKKLHRIWLWGREAFTCTKAVLSQGLNPTSPRLQDNIFPSNRNLSPYQKQCKQDAHTVINAQSPLQPSSKITSVQLILEAPAQLLPVASGRRHIWYHTPAPLSQHPPEQPLKCRLLSTWLPAQGWFSWSICLTE